MSLMKPASVRAVEPLRRVRVEHFQEMAKALALGLDRGTACTASSASQIVVEWLLNVTL